MSACVLHRKIALEGGQGDVRMFILIVPLQGLQECNQEFAHVHQLRALSEVESKTFRSKYVARATIEYLLLLFKVIVETKIFECGEFSGDRKQEE